MAPLTLKAAALTALAFSAADAQTPCCAFNGIGAATASGVGIINVGRGNENVPMSIAMSPSSLPGTASFATVIVGPPEGGIEGSSAGWIVSELDGVQSLTLWSNNTAGGPPPVCAKSVAPAGVEYMAAFSLCGGGPLYPYPADTYSIGPDFPVSGFSQVENRSTAYFASPGAGGCALVSFNGGNSPFGLGAFAINVLSGSAVAPTADWSVPPAACVF